MFSFSKNIPSTIEINCIEFLRLLIMSAFVIYCIISLCYLLCSWLGLSCNATERLFNFNRTFVLKNKILFSHLFRLQLYFCNVLIGFTFKIKHTKVINRLKRFISRHQWNKIGDIYHMFVQCPVYWIP